MYLEVLKLKLLVITPLELSNYFIDNLGITLRNTTFYP
jgi:hypothetical protein